MVQGYKIYLFLQKKSLPSAAFRSLSLSLKSL